jgi:hypothetical protein
MDLPAAPLDEGTAITSDASAALPSPFGALQQCSMPSADDTPAATAFVLEALPPDVARQILEIVACPDCPGKPRRLRALQPAALVCRAWRAAARQLVRKLVLEGGPEACWDGRDLSTLPQLSQLVFKGGIQGEDLASLLLTPPACEDPPLSAAAVGGGSSQAQNDKTHGAPIQNQRGGGAGASCFSGNRGGL